MAKPFEIIGHRGNGAGRGENTLTGCRQAIRNGADRLELDVQLIDGQLVCAHPPDRNGPLLTEIIAAIRQPLILHLKRRHFNPQHDRRAIDRLAKLARPSDLVASFWPGTLTYAKRRHPKLATAFFTSWPGYDLHFARRLGVAAFIGWHRMTDRHTVEHAARRGIALYAFPPHADQVGRLQQAGVAGVITDQVAATRKVLAAWRSRSGSSDDTAQEADR